MPKALPSKDSVLPRSRVMVAVTNNVNYELRCAHEYGLGVEIQVFGLPHMLVKDETAAIEQMAKRLDGIKGPIGCHGPFIDTIHYSQDPAIREVCRLRYLDAFDVAEALGASYVLFHSQYNPIIKIAAYPSVYHVQSLQFWPEIVEEAEQRKIPIYIENMFDESPEPIRRLVDAIGSPYMKLCLDVAHAAIHSKLDLAEWIDAYGNHLRHVHLNDCMGVLDDHLGLGQGVLDLERAFRLLKKTKLPLTYVLETGKQTGKSVKYLGLDTK